jgi:phosphomannomutase
VEDGVKIEFDHDWIHLRKSNTEPIVRIYAESRSAAEADALAKRVMAEMKTLMQVGSPVGAQRG